MDGRTPASLQRLPNASEVYRVDSSGPRNRKVEGCCNGGSAAFGSGFAGEAEVAWAATSGAAGAPAPVLGIHCRGFVERGCGDGGGGVAAGREPMVSGGGWDGAVAPVALVGVVLRAASLVCRA